MPLKGLSFKRLKEHFRKCIVYYIVTAIVLALLSSIVFTSTRPQVPDEYEVLIYVVDSYANTDLLDSLAEEALAYGQTIDETLQSVRFESVSFTGSDDYYSTVVLMARMSVGDGDVYIFGDTAKDYLLGNEVCHPLEDALAQGYFEGLQTITVEPVDDDGQPTGENYIGAVVMTGIESWEELGVRVDGGESYMLVANNGTNIDTSTMVADYVIRRLQEGYTYDTGVEEDTAEEGEANETAETAEAAEAASDAEAAEETAEGTAEEEAAEAASESVEAAEDTAVAENTESAEDTADTADAGNAVDEASTADAN